MNPSTYKSDLIIAHKIDDMIKIVYSRTLQNVTWKNSRLLKEVIPDEVERLKRQPGKDMVIYGSGSIVSAFMQSGLIDEYRIFVNPVVLGSGKPLFKDINQRVNLRHVDTRTLITGTFCFAISQLRKGGKDFHPGFRPCKANAYF